MSRSATSLPVVRGRARPGRRTKDLVGHLHAGEIAVIDHADLDRVAAEALVERRPLAVVNASPSITGRYPNIGPLLVVEAGIPLLDDTGDAVMDLDVGTEVAIDGDRLLVDDAEIAVGHRRSLADLQEAFEAARRSLGAELERFAANTLDYVRREHDLVTDAPDVPPTKVKIAGRDALVVVRGHHYKEDLEALRRGGYLREVRPVLIAVDGGADALLEIGQTPDIIIGDMDSVSEQALRCGAQLIVHAYPDGQAPGAERLDELGVAHDTWPSVGTSEDLALLLAHELGAELIVAVGTHSSMADFLDKGRAGMASTFLVRLRVGPVLVDARGVNRLYRSAVGSRELALLVAAAGAAVLAFFATSEVGQLFIRSLRLWFESLG